MTVIAQEECGGAGGPRYTGASLDSPLLKLSMFPK